MLTVWRPTVSPDFFLTGPLGFSSFCLPQIWMMNADSFRKPTDWNTKDILKISRSTTTPTEWCESGDDLDLGHIRPVWSESLLWALWVAKDPNLLQVDSKDQTGPMPRPIWVFNGGAQVILLVLSCSGSIFSTLPDKVSVLFYLRQVMRKPVYTICKQQWRTSACASVQSDQRLCCSLPR